MIRWHFIGNVWNTAPFFPAAMDGGEEKDVVSALCAYIMQNEYNPEICDYIHSVKWLPEESAA